MSRVNDILARKNAAPITISPTTTVIEALKIMAEKNIGSVIVMSGEKFEGIVTERDYSRKVILKGKSSTDTTAADIMTTELPHIHPEDSIEYCMELMTTLNIRYLPVFRHNHLTGIISMSDIVKATIVKQQETISHLESYIHSNI